VSYESCGDHKLTFASGWRTPVTPGDLRLLVNAPNGDLVTRAAAAQASTEATWDFARMSLPYNGSAEGSWRAQLVRPHRTFVNGFLPDSFADPGEGVRLVRRQIQRLCPGGCGDVLLFESGLLSPNSAYRAALDAELAAGLVGAVEVATPVDFAAKLGTPFDLIVYAFAGPSVFQPWDNPLAALLCQGQSAIVSDTRPLAGPTILECAGAGLDGTTNWLTIEGDGRLVDGGIQLVNPGRPVFSYGLVAFPPGRVQATANMGRSGAVVATPRMSPRCVRSQERCRNDLECPPGSCEISMTPCHDDQGCPGEERCLDEDRCAATSTPVGQNWFINVLGSGLSRIEPHYAATYHKTDDVLNVATRIFPSNYRAGGYDTVTARVEVEYPLVGLGTGFCESGLESSQPVLGDPISDRAATLPSLSIPTATAVFPLYDDGTRGDLEAGNHYWSANLTGLGGADGMYNLRFIMDFKVGDCTTTREFAQSVFVDVMTDPDASLVNPVATVMLPDGRLSTSVRIDPRDALGNAWGPGRPGRFSCRPFQACEIGEIRDNGDCSYTAEVIAFPETAGVRLQAFGALFDVALDCATCPDVFDLALDPTTTLEHLPAEGTIVLSGPAPQTAVGGALVYLDSDLSLTASVPPTVLVPAGQTKASFQVDVHHVINDNPVQVNLTATYGGSVGRETLTVLPCEAFSRPEEVQRLSASLPPGSPVMTLSWEEDPVAVSYNLYGAESKDLSDLACLRQNIRSTSVSDDGSVPEPGQAFFYLVNGLNCRGPSSLGMGSDSPRLIASPCLP
jgi:hypothetical protein